MPMRWYLPAALACLVSAHACIAPSDDPEALADRWPLSEIQARAKTPVDDSSSVVAGSTAEDPHSSSKPSSTGEAPDVGGVTGAATPGPGGSSGFAAPLPPPPQARERIDFDEARFPRPEHVRGIYLNAWASGSNGRVTALLDLARRTEVNAFVIDIKDATGYLSHATEVPLAHQIGATEERRIRDLPALLDRLEAEGIYPIARIVVVKDPILATFRPEYAIQDTAGGVWVDSKETVWLNPYSEEVWDYHIEIAREVAEMGFPEIQWDYIRFPDAPESDLARAVYTGAEGRERVEAIRGFLERARESLSDLPVRSTADVFGVTTTFSRDVGIGQVWEHFIDVVDVALPMVYPSHYWEGSFGYARPNAHPYEVVHAALRSALRRSATIEGAGTIRPWIQDFTLGPPVYAAAEVRAQIQATYDVGIDEWILWNPSSRYTEAALEPVEGFEQEPLVRVAGVLAPVSRRHHVLDSVAALPPEARGRGGSPVGSVTDTMRGPLPVDTIAPVDTIGPPVDSIVPPDTVAPVDTLRRAGASPSGGAGEL